MTFLRDTAIELWSLMLDTGVWLVAGLALAGVVHVLVPRRLLTKHLSGKGVGPVLKASLLGIPLPLCSCSVIPVAAGLRGSGASKGASAAFAISTPQTGEESIPLTWALFGPVYAFTRPILAVITAFAAGTLIEAFVKDRLAHASPPAKGGCCSGEGAEPEPASCCGGAGEPNACCGVPEAAGPAGECHEHEPEGSACCAREPAPKSCCSHEPVGPAKKGAAAKTGEVFRYGFVTLLRDLAPWLLIGFVLSAIIAAAVPEGWISEHVGTGLVPMLLMLVVGLPLYICATSSTPLAYTLVVAGLSPGAALVLLLAGPATNAATMSWVLKDLGAKALTIYLATIGVFAVAGGWAFDAMLRGTIRLAEQGMAHEHGVITLAQTAGAVVFGVLLVWALAARYGTPLLKGEASGEPVTG